MWKRAFLSATSCCKQPRLPRLVSKELHTNCTRSARYRQPTGRAGAISPWIRTPFLTDRAPPVGVDKSLQERLDAMEGREGGPGQERVDIGFLPEHREESGSNNKARLADWRRKVRGSPAMEKAAREGTLTVDLAVVKDQWEEEGEVFKHISAAAELYGIYSDLFHCGYFSPCVLLRVSYPQADGETLVPVHRGNMLKPAEMASQPQVSWQSSHSALWTLCCTGPDSSLTSPGQEVLHWLVANIQGSDLSTGDILAQYLQPHPPLGTGYHRVVFLLYRQEGRIDMEAHRRQHLFDLEERTFSTFDFYSQFQDELTPCGLAFGQADYDESLREFFHTSLNMREPRYEYEFPEHYVKPWRNMFTPSNTTGFDEFMDRHRDPKDLERQVLEQKLANTNPFTGDRDGDLKYPGLHEHERDLQEVFPPPVGDPPLQRNQSYKVAQWRRNAVRRMKRREGYFQSYDHMDLRRDPSTNC